MPIPATCCRTLAATLLALALAACNDSGGDAPAAPSVPGQPAAQQPPATTEPAQPEPTPKSISLKLIGRHATGQFDTSAAEIPAYDPATRQGFVVNAQKGKLDVLDLSDPAHPRHTGEIDANIIAPGATVNSVAVSAQGIVALAIEAAEKTDNGYIALYRADGLALLGSAQVGALPDMLTFTPDGRTVLVANEGEPSLDYQIDPEGSISVVDVSDPTRPTVRTADMRAFNTRKDELLAKGVRLFGPDQSQPADINGRYALTSVAQDIEPEYIAVSADGRTAWATLQENNALAKIDVASATVVDITPLGYKDHGLTRNALDISDSSPDVELAAYPGVYGMYLPDAIAAYQHEGRTYLVTANEGDSRAWGEDDDDYVGGDASKGFVEEFRVRHLINNKGFAGRLNDDLPAQLHAMADGALLNPDVFGYCGATKGDPGDCRDEEVLGRLTVTWTQGYQTDAQGDPIYYNRDGDLDPAGRYLMYDRLYAYGARSFSIWDEDGKLVWDAGSQFEQFLSSNACFLGQDRAIPCIDYFNSQHSEGNTRKDRSDDKGPEPEGLTIGRMGDKTFVFVGLERMGGVMVYDITDPAAPVFVDYLNTRENWTDDPESQLDAAGDLGPEGLHFVPASSSPNGKPLLIVGNEVSGTTSVYEIETVYDPLP